MTRDTRFGRLLLILISLLQSLCYPDEWKPAELRTSISFKKEPSNRTYPIARNVTGYVDLVENSDVFVDKSLLLKTIFECVHASMLITAPIGWGKSTNLDMIQTFVQLPYDAEGKELHPVGASKSFQFFIDGELMWHDDKYSKLQNPLLISAYEEFIYDHLGKYPVIRINMKEMLRGKSFAEIWDNIKLYLKELFNQFRFVVKPLFEVMQDEQATRTQRRRSHSLLCRYASFVNLNQQNATNIQHSIKFLCGLLFNHFRRRVVVLLDDYDHHLNIFLQNKDADKKDESDLAYFIHCLMRFAFKENAYLEKGILTGTFQFGTGSHHTPNSVAEFNYVYENPLLRFYGFTHAEILALLDHLQVPAHERLQVRQHYNGFRSTFENYTSLLYTPPSIVEFLAHRRFDNYIQTRAQNDIFEMIMRVTQIRGNFETLVNERSISINARSLYITRIDMDGLKSLLHAVSDNTQVGRTNTDMALAYLASAGYLAMGKIQRRCHLYRRLVGTHIPNAETMNEISRRLVIQYKQHFRISDILINTVVARFHECIEGQHPRHLAEALKRLYGVVNLFTKGAGPKLVFVNRSVHYSLLNLISLQMRSAHGYRTTVNEEFSKPNFVLKTDHRVVIVQTRTEYVILPSKNAALARKYRATITFANITSVTYMVWDFHYDKSVTIEIHREAIRKAPV